MLLMSRDYAIANERYRAKLLLELEPALLTPTERRRGIKLVAGTLRKELQAELRRDRNSI